jgi:tetratricopeptide (TPR) repeat protein
MATTMQKFSGPGTVEKLVREGAQALRGGRVAEAQDLARNLLAGHPRNPDALELLGMTLMAQNKASEAIEPLQNAARLRPGAIVETRLGQALRKTGRIAEALTVLQQASERQPPVSDAFFELGTLLYEKRRVAEAEAVLIRGLAVAPAAQLSFALARSFSSAEISRMRRLPSRAPLRPTRDILLYSAASAGREWRAANSTGRSRISVLRWRTIPPRAERDSLRRNVCLSLVGRPRRWNVCGRWSPGRHNHSAAR